MAGAAEHDLCHNTAMTEPVLALNEPLGERVERTTCYMCACRCGIKVHLKDDKIRYIEGNPEHPVNRGVLCAKGSAGIMQHYSPARLRQTAAARRRTRRKPSSVKSNGTRR